MAEQTIPSPTTSQVASWHLDRRAWLRLQSDQHAVWVIEAAHEAWLGIIRDISSGGMALSLRERLEPGTVLIVELETKTGRPRRALVRVTHSTRDTEDRWITGCAFVSPLSEEELRGLLEE